MRLEESFSFKKENLHGEEKREMQLVTTLLITEQSFP